MDSPQLAAEVAKFLAPFLLYLIAGTKTAAEEAGKQFGQAAWDKAVELWKKIWGKAKKKEAAKEAIEDAAEHPTAEDAQAAFRRQLTKLFEADEKLLDFVVETLNVATITIGGNVEKATIRVGNENKVINYYIQGNVYNGPAPYNPQDALKVYHAVMANMTASLSMRGIDLRTADPNTQRAIAPANVYIDLNTTTSSSEAEKVGEDDKSPRARIERDSKVLSALEAVIKFQSLVIKGDPGSGKSTFVNYLCYTSPS